EKPDYKMVRSWLVFDGPIRKAIHRVKYRRDFGLGDALADNMKSYLSELHWDIEMIIPVPLGRERFRERGYNQVGLIARPLAASQGWDFSPRALKRARETISQVGLSASERKDNVRGAFVADDRKVAGRSILLVDDVATTGATLDACAQALINGDARDVYALTIARALPHHGLKTV
ncbi:MAG: ComF family protein, partial [Anaerolineales bacterium]|nr:ComF family protein [Anaerolineales bacterium]